MTIEPTRKLALSDARNESTSAISLGEYGQRDLVADGGDLHFGKHEA